MLTGWRKTWENVELAMDYCNPIYATSAHMRETKPWYVCPRDPMIDGWKLDTYPFICAAGRDPSESPGRMIAISAATGCGIGIYTCLKDQMVTDAPGTFKRLNLNVRSTHTWAMKRLSWVWVLRPTLQLGFAAASYAIPKEIFCQNFGRRNRRGHFDPVPHFFGTLSLLVGARIASGGSVPAGRAALIYGGFGGLFYYWGKSQGMGTPEMTREFSWPVTMTMVYGAPGDHNQWDCMAGGEFGTHWRMESAVEYPFLAVNLFQVCIIHCYTKCSFFFFKGGEHFRIFFSGEQKFFWQPN